MQWASAFDVMCCLDSNYYRDSYSQFDCLIAAGVEYEISVCYGSAFDELISFYEKHHHWMFGLFSYELKNELENLKSAHGDQLDFPDLYFFVPQYLLGIKGDQIEVILGAQSVLQQIERTFINDNSVLNSIALKTRFDQKSYIETVKKLQDHIKRGDIYEVSFCQEFFAENAVINPLKTYQALSELSPTPFSGFFKIYDKFILSATPERFLCKRDQKLISQPIKGTAKRSKDLKEDQLTKETLRSSTKERAENVMIVDLVRNDLTKSAVKGSVKVDELFGIYSFPQVHQMISTISCELDPQIHFVNAIRNAFPMGSMTGAPKIKAMELIDTYEKSKRGAFSGSFGFIDPRGDFDFNVIIRSILYNQTTQYLSFQVGGAITYASNAEQEYEECLLKASAMMKVLGA